MRILKSLSEDIDFNLPILTIGTFDGVHLGHQEILKNLVNEAKLLNKESVLFSFHPHPRLVLDPSDNSIQMIDALEERIQKLKETGLDTLILFPFSKEFAQLTAEEFVKTILVDKIGVSKVQVGYDHHFGKNRSGNFAELSLLGTKYNFDVQQHKVVEINNGSVSSTKIRKAIQEGDFELAHKMLGRPFVVSGEVIKGKQLGRTINFPTANILMEQHKILPEIGVYPVNVFLGNRSLQGVANLGRKPTVQNNGEISLEVFIFDFDEEIYGELLAVSFFEKIRGEKKFASFDELKKQLHEDEKKARFYFAH